MNRGELSLLVRVVERADRHEAELRPARFTRLAYIDPVTQPEHVAGMPNQRGVRRITVEEVAGFQRLPYAAVCHEAERGDEILEGGDWRHERTFGTSFYSSCAETRGWKAHAACVRAGLRYGQQCVIGCWALMLTMAVAGHASLALTLFLAILIASQRLLVRGTQFGPLASLALVSTAVFLVTA